MLIPHKGHTDTIQVYSVTVMTHVKALQAGHSSQGTSEPITPVLDIVPVHPGSFWHVKNCRGGSRFVQEHPGPSRTTRHRYGSTTGSPRFTTVHEPWWTCMNREPCGTVALTRHCWQQIQTTWMPTLTFDKYPQSPKNVEPAIMLSPCFFF